MNLLICTQVVDKHHPSLGFFHGWLEAFAKQCAQVTVVCLQKGEHTLPDNVRVVSLGKETKQSRLQYMIRFYRYAWKYRNEYQTVFVHMNPEYVVLGGLLWRVLGKKVFLWYVHRQVNLKLRIATLLAHTIFTVSEKSFRLHTQKKHIVGHGIDPAIFAPQQKPLRDLFHIASVGRITPIKELHTLVQAIAMLNGEQKKQLCVDIIGSPTDMQDEHYKNELEDMIARQHLGGYISFVDPVPYTDMPSLYARSDLVINLTPTGGLDKVVLEAMACEVPVLVSNEAFAPYFGPYTKELLFRFKDAKELASKIGWHMEHNVSEMKTFLRKQIVAHHTLSNVIGTILKQA